MTHPNPVLDLRQIPALKKRGKSKYHAVRTQNADGSWSDSKKEAAWDAQIMAAAKAAGLEVQRKERFQLTAHGAKIAIYEADWCIYITKFPMSRAIARMAVIDCKGFKTREYRMKKKMFEAQYGRKIIEDLNEALKIITGEGSYLR